MIKNFDRYQDLMKTNNCSLLQRPSLDDFRSPNSTSRQKREGARQNVKSLLRTKRIIVLTSLHKRQQNSVTNAIRVLGGASMREKVDKNTTHVVTNWPLRRTLSLLRARLLGLPVVLIDWLLESREAGHWLPEKKYLVSATERLRPSCLYAILSITRH